MHDKALEETFEVLSGQKRAMALATMMRRREYWQ